MTVIKEIPTCDLVNELKTREGVDYADVAPYVEYSVNVPKAYKKSFEFDDVAKDGTGPCTVIIVTD
jgi:hypothetical protein